jgi:uncharacterized membrane protein
MVYNVTGIAQNSTTVLGLVQGVNTGLVGGWFGTMFLIGLFFVFYTSFIYAQQDPKDAFSTATYLCFGLAILLAAMDLIPMITLFITVIVSSVATAGNWLSNR